MKSDFLARMLLAGFIGITSFQSNAQTNAIQASGQQNGTNGIGKAETFALPPGDKVEPATPQALAEIKAKAEKGDASAQCELGDSYAKGRGVPQDFAQALKWYRKSAEQGFGLAQLSLARMYCYGIGAATNYDEALKWLRSAETNDGSGVAQYQVGWCYTKLMETTNDPSVLFTWYNNASGSYWASAMKGFGPGALRWAEGLEDTTILTNAAAESFYKAMKWDGWHSTDLTPIAGHIISRVLPLV